MTRYVSLLDNHWYVACISDQTSVRGNMFFYCFIYDNGKWFIVSYDSANKQKHYKKPLH